MKNIIQNKKRDAFRLCEQFKCVDILSNIIDKLDNISTTDEANSFDTSAEIFNLCGGLGLELEKRMLKFNLTKDLKMKLLSTDYKVLKYLEGWITEEEYNPIKEERQSLRDKINNIENKINACTTIKELQVMED